MPIEPTHHRVDERSLDIEGRLVAGDPVLTEALGRGADILMLVFDRTTWPADRRLQQTVMPGLAVGAPGDVVGEHREIVRDDRVVLLVGPVTVHRRPRRDWRGWRGR
jgi:hypothetical protein